MEALAAKMSAKRLERLKRREARKKAKSEVRITKLGKEIVA